MGCTAAGGGGSRGPAMGFKGVPPLMADKVTVPEGYTATPLAPWGEPVGIAGHMPAFRFDAGNTAAEQAVQMGMHHDGIHYYALDGSRRGLLCLNQEYTDEALLHTTGQTPWTPEKVRKSQNAHGITVIEIELQGANWQMVRPSKYARRITALTPFRVGGPAAGHVMMKTAADPEGRTVLGTIANCAGGKTPWGTYLSGEENWANYFTAADVPTAHEKRWGIRRATWYRWPEHDERFDTVRNPNEPNRFGWIVEVDPMDPTSTPVKRTAIGRAAHEGAWVAVTKDGRAVVYSGEDARFEYIYRFVSRDKIAPAGNGKTAAQANAELLDHGTLYVARFHADGSGEWLALVHGQGPLTASQGFADQGEVLIKARPDGEQLAVVLAVAKAVWTNDQKELVALTGRHGNEDQMSVAPFLATAYDKLRQAGFYQGGAFAYRGEWYLGVERLPYLEARLAGDETYRRLFAAAYPGDASPIRAAHVTRALAAFTLRASFDHASLRERDGGAPMAKDDVLAPARAARGLVFLDTDHGFALASEPSLEPSAEAGDALYF